MLCDVNKCTGCAACYAICNFDAIRMIEDELGVLHPVINEEKCKQCGLCEKVCPEINGVSFLAPESCYAAYTKNISDVDTVASGGIATAFGRYVISQKGAVFGTILENDGRFECVETEDGLEQFKGSKYVHICPYNIYRKVKTKLEENKECLFVGTPCQVAGLKSFLGKNYNNLITVDLICHGTPPFAYLEEHLSEKKIYNYSRITFRGKDNFSLTCYNEKGDKVYSMPHHMDEYFFSFLNSLTYKEACYDCKYAKKERVSDITIGDFWGLADDALDGYKGKKSVVLINTQNGKMFFKKVKTQLVYQERCVNEAIEGNAQLRVPSKKPRKRDVFIKYYKRDGFKKAMKISGVLRIVKVNLLKNRIKNLFVNK